MRKRTITYLCLFALLAALLIPSAHAAGAELEIKAPAGPVSAGESFAVTVGLTDSPDICAIQFALTFDRDLLECVSARLTELPDGAIGGVNAKASPGVKAAVASPDPISGDAVLLTATFLAKSDLAAPGFGLSDVVVKDAFNSRMDYTVRTSAQPGGGEIQGGQSGGGEMQGGRPDDGQSAVDTPEISFTDVDGHWGKGDVLRAAELGLFTGYPDGSFLPDATITRADFVTVLWRLAGSPGPSAGAGFRDVAEGAYYADAVAWAREKGYVDGISADEFDPTGLLQRQAAMKILFRYNGGNGGAETLFTGVYDSTFADSADIADWARTPMYWGYYHGLISGVGDNLLSPAAYATRAQLARILVHYIDRFDDNQKHG